MSALLLFVCSGNICRSPMAAVIAQAHAQREGLEARVESSGTKALVDWPAEDNAHAVVAELGLTLKGHRARQTDPEMLREAALVVAATDWHRAWLHLLEPGAAHKIHTFDQLTGFGDLPDPYGADIAEYRGIRDLLVAGTPRVLAAFKARLAAPAKAPPSA